MFKDVAELQEFIIWAKAHKVKRVKMDKIEVELSDYGLIEDLVSSQPAVQANLHAAVGLTPPTPEQQQKEDDDLLFHSAN